MVIYNHNDSFSPEKIKSRVDALDLKYGIILIGISVFVAGLFTMLTYPLALNATSSVLYNYPQGMLSFMSALLMFAIGFGLAKSIIDKFYYEHLLKGKLASYYAVDYGDTIQLKGSIPAIILGDVLTEFEAIKPINEYQLLPSSQLEKYSAFAVLEKRIKSN